MSAYALLVSGGLWLFVWQTRPRWLGIALITVGAVLALTAQPPDLLVSVDGHHVAVLLDAYDAEGPRLALLRERTGDFLRDVWSRVTASTSDAATADLPAGACTVDACVARVGTGPSALRLLATLSKGRIGRPAAPRLVPPALAQARPDRAGDDSRGRNLAEPGPGRNRGRAHRRPPMAAAAAGVASESPARSHHRPRRQHKCRADLLTNRCS